MRFAASKFALLALAGLAIAPEAFACHEYSETVAVPTDPINWTAPDRVVCRDHDANAATESIFVQDLTLPVPATPPQFKMTVADTLIAPSLTCEGMMNSFLCEAYPQSSNGALTYTWTTTGRATMPYPPGASTPFYQFGCSGYGSGTVTVVVTKPGGQTVQATRNVWCGGAN